MDDNACQDFSEGPAPQAPTSQSLTGGVIVSVAVESVEYIGTCISICLYIHTCMHAWMHASVHTYIHTYLHTYLHTYIHTVYTYTCTYDVVYVHIDTHVILCCGYCLMRSFVVNMPRPSSLCMDAGLHLRLRQMHSDE